MEALTRIQGMRNFTTLARTFNHNKGVLRTLSNMRRFKNLAKLSKVYHQNKLYFGFEIFFSKVLGNKDCENFQRGQTLTESTLFHFCYSKNFVTLILPKVEI